MIETARERLESERQRIQGSLAHTRGELLNNEGLNEPTTNYGNHLADGATETFEDEKAVALENHLRGPLSEVEHALDRLSEDTYGTCENCGRAIAPERLEALPWAVLCIECKSRQDHGR